MKIKDANVLITGGASGIGRIMGRMALERGAARLIIWDINAQNIELVKAELSSFGNVSGFRVDVSDKTLIELTVGIAGEGGAMTRGGPACEGKYSINLKDCQVAGWEKLVVSRTVSPCFT